MWKRVVAGVETVADAEADFVGVVGTETDGGVETTLLGNAWGTEAVEGVGITVFGVEDTEAV